MRLVTNTSILYVLGAFLSPTALVHASSSTKLRGHDAAASSSSSTTTTNTRRLKKPIDDTTCVTTTLVEVEHSDPSIDESYLSCESSDGNTSYKVKGISQEVINKNKKSIADGESSLELPAGAMINLDDGSIELPSDTTDDDVKFKENNGKKKGLFKDDSRDRRRKLVSGTRSVLVVRVQHATDASTSASAERLSDSVFGNGADGSVDPVTLKSQYSECSYGQLTFIEAADRTGNTGTLIQNGTYIHMFCYNIMLHVRIYDMCMLILWYMHLRPSSCSKQHPFLSFSFKLYTNTSYRSRNRTSVLNSRRRRERWNDA